MLFYVDVTFYVMLCVFYSFFCAIQCYAVILCNDICYVPQPFDHSTWRALYAMGQVNTPPPVQSDCEGL